MRNLADPNTGLANFVSSLSATAAEVAPVARSRASSSSTSTRPSAPSPASHGRSSRSRSRRAPAAEDAAIATPADGPALPRQHRQALRRAAAGLPRDRSGAEGHSELDRQRRQGPGPLAGLERPARSDGAVPAQPLEQRAGAARDPAADPVQHHARPAAELHHAGAVRLQLRLDPVPQRRQPGQLQRRGRERASGSSSSQPPLAAGQRDWAQLRRRPTARAACRPTSSTTTPTRTPPRRARRASARPATRAIPADSRSGTSRATRASTPRARSSSRSRQGQAEEEEEGQEVTPDARADTAALAAAQGLRRADLPQGEPAAPGPQRPDPDRARHHRHLPGLDEGDPLPVSHFELHAVFKNAANIRKDSPVRIAGVNVGKVVSVKSVCDNGLTGNCASNYSDVTFTVDDSGQPIHSDAQIEIRPRIFLEGNFFLDVSPGSPSAHRPLERRHDPGHPDLHRGPARPDPHLAAGTRPREPAEAARGLRHRAHAQADRRRRRDPGPGGPGPDRRRRRSTSPSTTAQTAARDSAIVNEALLGHRAARPLRPDRRSGEDLRRAQRPRVPAPGAGHQLQHRRPGRSPTSPPTCSGRSSCSARPCEIAEPSLRHTNATLPFLRTFARDLTPASRELPATIAASPALARPDRGAARSRASSASSPTSSAWPAPGSGQGGRRRARALLPDRPDQRLRRTTCCCRPATSCSATRAPATTSTPACRTSRSSATRPPTSPARAPSFDGNGPYLRFHSGGGPVPAGGPVPNLRASIPGGSPGRDALWAGSTATPIGTRPVGLRDAALQDRRRLSEQPDPRPERAGGRAGPAGPGPVPMRRALRAHLRDVLAIIGLVLAGLFAVTVILINQRASLPSWVPVIGTDFFAPRGRLLHRAGRDSGPGPVGRHRRDQGRRGLGRRRSRTGTRS